MALKPIYRPSILKGRSYPGTSPTSVEMVNHMTFSQDDEIDEDVENYDFPITLIELLKDLEPDKAESLIKMQMIESRKSYDGDMDSGDSFTDRTYDQQNLPRANSARITYPMYNDELLSAWSPELTASSHPPENSKQPCAVEDTPSVDEVEHDFTNFVSSKEDESSAEGSQPQLFLGWCGIMMCTQNDSNLDLSPSDDEDESSWKKESSKEPIGFGRRHLLKDDDCIYLTNEASVSLHNSLTASSHYRAFGKRNCQLLNELSNRTHHFQVATASETQKITSVDTTFTEQRLTSDDTQHVIGCFRRELCMNTDNFKLLKEDFCVIPEDFKSFDQVGGRHDSLEESRSTFETVLVESQHQLYETLVISASKEMDNDVTLNPHQTETSGEEDIPMPPSMKTWRYLDDLLPIADSETRSKDLSITSDSEIGPKDRPCPMKVNTSTNSNFQRPKSPSKRPGLPPHGLKTLLVTDTLISQSENCIRRNRTAEFSERKQRVLTDYDMLSEASDVLSIDGFGDENIEEVYHPIHPYVLKETSMLKEHTMDDDDSDLEWLDSSRFSLEASSKPLILLMDGLVLSSGGLENGPVDSGETSVCNNLTSTGKEADETIQYLLDDSYDSEPEPQVSGFADDDSDDESLIDYDYLEQQIYQFLQSTKKVSATL